jgi:hypothetical protein
MSAIESRFALTGPHAFYNRPDYKTTLRNELGSHLPPVAYTCQRETFSPAGQQSIFKKVARYFVGKCVVPASLIPNFVLDKIRLQLLHDTGFVYKRFSIACGNEKIDTLIAGTPETFSQKRWGFFVGGCTETYEITALVQRKLLLQLRCNGIFFNYIGLGRSSGSLTKESMAASVRAALEYLEEQQDVEAEEIIFYGYSMGAAAQALGLKGHLFKPHIECLAVKDRTFDRLDTLFPEPFGKIIRWAGWDMNVGDSSKSLPISEVIFQRAFYQEYQEIPTGSDNPFRFDGLIRQQASLGARLYQEALLHRKYFFSMEQNHFFPARNPEKIASIVREKLQNLTRQQNT